MACIWEIAQLTALQLPMLFRLAPPLGPYISLRTSTPTLGSPPERLFVDVELNDVQAMEHIIDEFPKLETLDRRH